VRLIFLTQYYPPEVGAPQARLSAIAEGLARSGADVTVHTCFPNYPDGRIKEPFRNRPLAVDEGGPVRIVRSGLVPAANRGFARRLASQASFGASALLTSRASGPADAVIVESPPLFLAGAAIPYARLKRAALIVHVSDLWPESAVELGVLRSPAAIRSARALESRCYLRARAIVCPTEGIEQILAARPDARGKVRRIAPSVDLDRFRLVDLVPESREGRPFRILYAGTLGLAQGVGTLLEAVELLRRDSSGSPVEAVVAGDGAEADALRSRLPTGVRMPGSVPANQVPSLYANADAAVVLLRDRPLFAGALPTKLLEAMAAARPVVLAARGEAARLVERAGAGLVVPPEDPAALAEALRRLAGDPQLGRGLGATGRRIAEAEFGRERAVDEWDRLISEIARSSG